MNLKFIYCYCSCKSETFSTLRFAQRAKAIKNKAVVNEVTQDDVNVLREVIRQLKVFHWMFIGDIYIYVYISLKMNLTRANDCQANTGWEPFDLMKENVNQSLIDISSFLVIVCLFYIGFKS